jgi:hypothetical protein
MMIDDTTMQQAESAADELDEFQKLSDALYQSLGFADALNIIARNTDLPHGIHAIAELLDEKLSDAIGRSESNFDPARRARIAA